MKKIIQTAKKIIVNKKNLLPLKVNPFVVTEEFRRPAQEKQKVSNYYPNKTNFRKFGSFFTQPFYKQPPQQMKTINELSFTGGGGKGSVYLSAVKRLRALRVLDLVQCCSGSSAGSLVANFLAFNPSDEDMFEAAKKMPNILRDIQSEEEIQKKIIDPQQTIVEDARRLKDPSYGPYVGEYSSDNFGAGVGDLAREVSYQIKNKIKRKAFSGGEELLSYVVTVNAKLRRQAIEDFLGSFPKREKEMGEFLENNKINISKDDEDITFAQHEKLRKAFPELNFRYPTFSVTTEDGELFNLNAKNTPDLGMAFAAAASARFPFIFEKTEAKIPNKDGKVKLGDGGIKKNMGVVSGENDPENVLVLAFDVPSNKNTKPSIPKMLIGEAFKPLHSNTNPEINRLDNVEETQKTFPNMIYLPVGTLNTLNLQFGEKEQKELEKLASEINNVVDKGVIISPKNQEEEEKKENDRFEI